MDGFEWSSPLVLGNSIFFVGPLTRVESDASGTPALLSCSPFTMLSAINDPRYYGAMATTAIDTLRYARKLKDAGVPPDQAEAMADAIGSELVDQLATKADLQSAVQLLRTELGGSIRLVQWMLGFTLAFVVAIAWRVFV